MEPENEDSKIECIVCQRKFKRRSALYRHLRGVHKLTVEFAGRKYKFKCPDSGCSVTFHLSEKLRNHITEVHGVQIELCVKWFNSFSDFQKWKDAVQDKMKSLYVSCQNKKSLNQNKHFYYVCSRSGYVSSKSAGKRKSSSKKIDGWCPSGMEVKVFHNKGVQVKFWMTHFGHSCEVDQLNLSRKEKLIIAKKLKEGLSHEKILDDIRHSVLDDDIRRIHLVSRTDIYNISRSFKIANKESLVENEATSISSWVENMEALGENCPVIFYKEKGSEHRNLKANDYMLVIMSKVQQQLLERCENRIICIDDIKVCQSYNYHLMTLMTVDEFNIACPLAFCVSNKIDECVALLFSEVIYSKVGAIAGNIFMSSDIPALYSAWQKVMGSVDTQLLCSWQVDRDWWRALEKPPCSEEKKVRVYKILRQLMEEEDFDEFRAKIEATVEELEADADLKRFCEYFKTKYVERCELWAACYRTKGLLIQCNTILKQIHKGLVECYEEGRVINSFVRTLNLIVGFCRDRVLEKLEKLPGEFQIKYLGNVFQKVEEIEEIDVVKTQEVSEKHFQLPTGEKDSCYVEHNVSKVCPPDCIPVCDACNICYHKFTCTCMENIVSLNICRHIQASVNMMSNQCNHSEDERMRKINIENSEAMFLADEMPVTREEVVEYTKEREVVVEIQEESEVTIDGEDASVEKVIYVDANSVIEMACDIESASYEDTSDLTHGDARSNIVEVAADSEGPVSDIGFESENNVDETACRDGSTVNEAVCESDTHEAMHEDESFIEGVDFDEDTYDEMIYDDEVTFEHEGSDVDSDEEECNVERLQAFLLKKITFVQDLIKSRTFKADEYEMFDDCLNKIIGISNSSS